MTITSIKLDKNVYLEHNKITKSYLHVNHDKEGKVATQVAQSCFQVKLILLPQVTTKKHVNMVGHSTIFIS
jgi:hypothetical protein